MIVRRFARWVSMGGAVASVGWAAAGFLGGAATGGCAPEGPAAKPSEPIVIGVSFGLSESLASFTESLQKAVRAAEGQINASGGLLGRPVRFDVVDDRSNNKEYIDGVAQGFIASNVAAVIGPVGSSQVDRIQAALRGRQILLISPSATSTTLTSIQPAKDRYLFRTVPSDEFQVKALVRLARLGPAGFDAPAAGDAGAGDAGGDAGDAGPPSAEACPRMFIVHADNKYGGPMADALEASYPGPGRQVVGRVKVAEEVVASYDAVVAQVLAAKPDCLALIQYDDVGGALTRAIDKARRDNPTALPPRFFLMGTDGVYTSGYLENSRDDKGNPASRNAAEGVYGTNPDTNPPTPEYNEMKNIFTAYFPLKAGEEVPAFVANTYDAAVLIALAIQQAGSATDRVKIRDALFQVSRGGKAYSPAQLNEALLAIRQGDDVDYNGASGTVDFDDNGNVEGGFIVWKVEKGQFVTAGRIPQKDLGN
ncbi:MAG TPA: ABC transporter substrate-binding protein [Polyangiaceae bacterium]|nr:ABC transporter substrate-binding protein [Polyangiaceae bacterium]